MLEKHLEMLRLNNFMNENSELWEELDTIKEMEKLPIVNKVETQSMALT